MTRSIRLALALFAALTLPSSRASAIEADDRRALREVIEKQIDAFRHDDGAAAFAFASPGLRDMFGGPDRFMAMVRDGYRPVYRPRSYTFGADRDGAAGPELALRIQDENGVDWDAVYVFEKDPDGVWRISGCRLVKAPGESA